MSGYDQRVIDIAKKASEAAAKNASLFRVPPQMLFPDIVFAINDALDAGVIALTPATAPDREAIAREVKEALRGDYTDRGMEDAFFRWPIIERAILSLMGEG